MNRPHEALDLGGKRRRRRRRVRRGMYLLPSLFTVGNIFCGYVSIVRAMMGDYELAALLILIAALLDALDGRVARMTGTSSDFGLQFDSIADIVSFGVAPAVLSFTWSLSSFGRIGWAVSFLFVMCGALRLARFNLQQEPYSDRRYFIGMPIPAAACIIATTVYAHPVAPDPTGDPLVGGMLLIIVLLISLLMVSRLRYRSFKELDLKTRKSHKYLLIPAAALAAVMLNPQIVLMLVAYAYLLSGIFPRTGTSRHAAREVATGMAARDTGRGGGDDGD